MASKRSTISEHSSSKTYRSTLNAGEGVRFRWEASDFENAHSSFTKWADHVRDRPASIDRRKRNLLYMSLYSNEPILGFGVNSYTRNTPSAGRISLNATQNAVDTLVSKVCKNRPRPSFSTVDGPFELQEKVENADLYVDGRFGQIGYYTTVYPGKVLDTCVYGLGVSKVEEVDGEATVSRIYPWEMILDSRELMYGKPQRIGQRKFYDKQVAFDLFRKTGNGKSEKEWNRDLEQVIDSRTAEQDWEDFDRDESSEQVIVYEGWSAATKHTPGKSLVCLRGKTLRFEEHRDVESWYNFQRPEVSLVGFYGKGMVERVCTIQAEINRLVRDIQMAMHLIAKPHWMVEASSNVNMASLNNDIATIIKYQGAIPPTVYTPQSMSGEVFSHLQYLVKTLYEIMGVSQLSAQSQKPAGIDSAVGMRTYLNIETERFNNFVRASEEGASQDALKLAKMLGRTKPKGKVMPVSGKFGRMRPQVEWSDLDFDTVQVQVQPSSKLPDTPAGKREYALELAQYTQVTTNDILEMLEWDDTEAFVQEKLAGKKNVRRDIAKMRAGTRVVRDAIGDHKMAYSMMLDAYEQARGDGVPEKRLGYFRDYIKACYRYLTGKVWSAQGPNPLEPPAGPMPGPGMPPPGTAPMGAPNPMMPPGVAPPPPDPMANGGVPLPPEAA